jgi:hypothetical protein
MTRQQGACVAGRDAWGRKVGFSSPAAGWTPILDIWKELCQSNAGSMDQPNRIDFSHRIG